MARKIDPAELPVGRDATDDIWEAIYTQRAIRYWQQKPVPRELLEQVVAAASKAPSGGNLQPWIFVAVDDRAKLDEISSAIRGFWEGAESIRALMATREQSGDRSQRLMMRGARTFFSQPERAPAMILACLYQLSSPDADPATLLAGSSIYGAVQNLQLVARALGLGTVLTTVHEMIEADLRKTLELPPDAHPAALIPIGFPDANFGPTKRRPVDEILRWNGW